MVAASRGSIFLAVCALGVRGDLWTSDCTFPGYEFLPVISTPGAVDLVDSQATNAAECQMRCTVHDGCAFWTFYHSNRCTLSHLDAHPHWLNSTSPGVISGGAGPDGADFCGCLATPTLIAGAAFPGASGLAAHAAWSTGRQPLGLGCWPKGAHDGPNAYQLYPCNQDVTVLQSTTNGWRGECLNLEEIPYPDGNTNDAWCEENCRATPTCPSWQVPPRRNNNDVLSGGCWYGVGDHCNFRSGNPSFHPEGAERLKHGQVQVLLNVTGFKVLNLHNVFSNEYATEHSADDAIRDCKYVCYSNIDCQYWQYVQESGCWVEHPRNNGGVPRPLTEEGINANPGVEVLAGEFIQHWCAAPVAGTLAAPVAAPVPGSPLAPDVGANMTLIVGVASCVLIGAVIAAACLFMRANGSKREKKTRAVKAPKVDRRPPPSPPVEEVMVPRFAAPPLQVPTMSVILPQYSHIQPVPTNAMAYASPPGSVSMIPGGQPRRTMAMRGP